MLACRRAFCGYAALSGAHSARTKNQMMSGVGFSVVASLRDYTTTSSSSATPTSSDTLTAILHRPLEKVVYRQGEISSTPLPTTMTTTVSEKVPDKSSDVAEKAEQATTTPTSRGVVSAERLSLEPLPSFQEYSRRFDRDRTAAATSAEDVNPNLFYSKPVFYTHYAPEINPDKMYFLIDVVEGCKFSSQKAALRSHRRNRSSSGGGAKKKKNDSLADDEAAATQTTESNQEQNQQQDLVGEKIRQENSTNYLIVPDGAVNGRSFTRLHSAHPCSISGWIKMFPDLPFDEKFGVVSEDKEGGKEEEFPPAPFIDIAKNLELQVLEGGKQLLFGFNPNRSVGKSKKSGKDVCLPPVMIILGKPSMETPVTHACRFYIEMS